MPLLQFTLDQLFQRRMGRQLTLSAYREMGGVKGALTRKAEETYAALHSDEHRELARALFVRLIDLGATEQDTMRRRAAVTEFELTDPVRTRLLSEVIDSFIAARLLTINYLAGTTTLEVSHEAVIRAWPRLAGWMQEARENMPLQRAISQDASEWRRRGEPVDRLYRGSQLDEALAWAKQNWPSRQEEAFLQASAAERERQQWAEEERKLQERQRQRRYTRRVFLVGAAGVGLAVAAVVTVQIIQQYESQFVHLPYTYSGHTDTVESVAWAPDGSKLASASHDKTVQVWDAHTGKTLLTYRAHANAVFSVAWAPDGSKLASASLDDSAPVWDAHTGYPLFFYQDPTGGITGGINSVAWAPDGSKLASASNDATVQVWDTHGYPLLLTYRGHKNGVLSVAWAPDGSKLASASRDWTVQVWLAL